MFAIDKHFVKFAGWSVKIVHRFLQLGKTSEHTELQNGHLKSANDAELAPINQLGVDRPYTIIRLVHFNAQISWLQILCCNAGKD